MQVIYILLLLVVTIVCIGVSAGVKYDKESYVDTSPGEKFGHNVTETKNTMTTDDQARATIVSHIKTPVDTGVSTKTNLDFINSSTTETEHHAIFSIGTKKITYTSGQTKISDVDALFGNKTTSFKANVGQTSVITLTESGTSLYTIKHGSTTLNYTNKYNRPDTNVFNFNESGILVDVFNNFIVSSSTDLSSASLSAKKIAATTDNIMRIGKSGSDTILQFGNPVYGSITTNLFKLEYFGINNNTNLPPPIPTQIKNNSISQVSSTGTVTFNTFPQTLDPNSTSNVLGFFAKYKTDGTATASITPADFTGGTLTSTSTNFQIEYLKLSQNLQLQSLEASYSFTPSSSTLPFYSIYLVLDDGIQTYNPTYTIIDDNTVRGTQSIVIFGSTKPKTTTGEYLLARGSTDLTSALELTTTNLEKNLFGLYGGFNMNAIVFFPMCIQNGVGSNESFTVNYDASTGFTLEQSTSLSTTLIDYNSGHQNLNYLFYAYEGDTQLTEYLQNDDGAGGRVLTALRST